MKYTRKITLALLALVLLAPLFGQTQKIEIGVQSFIQQAIDNSFALATQEEDIELAKTNLWELELSDVSELDIEQAKISRDVSILRYNETRASLIINAVSAYLSVLEAERNLEHAQTNLEIMGEREAASKRQVREGVKKELDYFKDYLAFRNAEIGEMNARINYQKAVRALLYMINVGPESEATLESYEITAPDQSATRDAIINAAKTASSSYVKATREAVVNERRYAAHEALGTSVSQKRLQELRRAMDAAANNALQQTRSLEDQSWELLLQYEVLLETVELAEEQLEIAEKNWEERQRGFKFGVILQIDLDSAELQYEREIDTEKQRRKSLFLHYLRIYTFTGQDPLEVVNRQ